MLTINKTFCDEDLSSECSFVTAKTSLTRCSDNTSDFINTSFSYPHYQRKPSPLTPYPKHDTNICRLPGIDETDCSSTATTAYSTSDSSTYSNVIFEDDEEEQTLVDLIEQRDYERATARIKTHPNELKQKIQLTSSTDGGNVLLLHLALRHRPLPPVTFIRELIDVYPLSVCVKEKSWGHYPLHLACQSGQKRKSGTNRMSDHHDQINYTKRNQFLIVKELLDAFPEAASEKESFRGLLPIHMAVSNSECSIGVIQLLIKAFPEGLCCEDEFGDFPVDFASRSRREIAEKKELIHGLETLVNKMKMATEQHMHIERSKICTATSCHEGNKYDRTVILHTDNCVLKKRKKSICGVFSSAKSPCEESKSLEVDKQKRRISYSSKLTDFCRMKRASRARRLTIIA